LVKFLQPGPDILEPDALEQNPLSIPDCLFAVTVRKEPWEEDKILVDKPCDLRQLRVIGSSLDRGLQQFCESVLADCVLDQSLDAGLVWARVLGEVDADVGIRYDEVKLPRRRREGLSQGIPDLPYFVAAEFHCSPGHDLKC